MFRSPTPPSKRHVTMGFSSTARAAQTGAVMAWSPPKIIGVTLARKMAWQTDGSGASFGMSYWWLTNQTLIWCNLIIYRLRVDHVCIIGSISFHYIPLYSVRKPLQVLCLSWLASTACWVRFSDSSWSVWTMSSVPECLTEKQMG